MPRLRGRELEAAEQQIGHAKPRVMKSGGPAKDALEPATIERVDRPVNKEWADMMAFSKEKVTIRVSETTEKNAERVVEVFNNGERQLFPRGQEVTCERRFVESLARAKITTYTQQQFRDERTQTDNIREVPHVGLRYPFTVIRDDHPRGMDWLKSILAEA